MVRFMKLGSVVMVKVSRRRRRIKMIIMVGRCQQLAGIDKVRQQRTVEHCHSRASSVAT